MQISTCILSSIKALWIEDKIANTGGAIIMQNKLSSKYNVVVAS